MQRNNMLEQYYCRNIIFVNNIFIITRVASATQRCLHHQATRTNKPLRNQQFTNLPIPIDTPPLVEKEEGTDNTKCAQFSLNIGDYYVSIMLKSMIQ